MQNYKPIVIYNQKCHLMKLYSIYHMAGNIGENYIWQSTALSKILANLMLAG